MYSCADDYIASPTVSAGSLFRLPAGSHTVISWVQQSHPSSPAQPPFASSCSHDEIVSGACALSDFLPNSSSPVLAYTSTTFTQLPTPVSKVPYVTSKTSASGLSDKATRQKYFDGVYEAEIWSFPDWDASAGLGVRSGFGSTLHQTEHIRPYLDMIISNFHISSVLDVPCGDMHWMPHVAAIGDPGLCFFGGDVSSVMIKEQQVRRRERA
jgi:hypothetical protein